METSVRNANQSRVQVTSSAHWDTDDIGSEVFGKAAVSVRMISGSDSFGCSILDSAGNDITRVDSRLGRTRFICQHRIKDAGMYNITLKLPRYGDAV